MGGTLFFPIHKKNQRWQCFQCHGRPNYFKTINFAPIHSCKTFLIIPNYGYAGFGSDRSIPGIAVWMDSTPINPKSTEIPKSRISSRTHWDYINLWAVRVRKQNRFPRNCANEIQNYAGKRLSLIHFRAATETKSKCYQKWLILARD